MNEVDMLMKKIYKYVFILYCIFLVMIILFDKNYLPSILGLTFGSLIGVLNFMELSKTIQKSVLMNPGKARNYVTRNYFIRFVLTGIVIYVSIMAPYINVLGTILGLVLIKIVIYFTNLFNKKGYFKNIFSRKEEK